MPVVDQVSADYADEVTFVAVAGRSSLERTEEAAPSLFGDRLLWGFDESIWDLYGVPGQPVTFLISGDDRVVGGWYGARDEAGIREALDGLVGRG